MFCDFWKFRYLLFSPKCILIILTQSNPQNTHRESNRFRMISIFCFSFRFGTCDCQTEPNWVSLLPLGSLFNLHFINCSTNRKQSEQFHPCRDICKYEREGMKTKQISVLCSRPQFNAQLARNKEKLGNFQNLLSINIPQIFFFLGHCFSMTMGLKSK